MADEGTHKPANRRDRYGCSAQELDYFLGHCVIKRNLTDQVDRRAFSDVHKAATPALRQRQFGLMQSASGPTR